MGEHDLDKPLLEERCLFEDEYKHKNGLENNANEPENKKLESEKRNNGFFSSMSVEKRLICAIIFCLIFTAVELTVGLISHSLALLSDASHLISDLCSYFISLFGIYLSKKKATKTMSFGYNRAEILGALLSILLIWIMTLILVYEAIQRMVVPVDVDGFSMFITALFGTLSNLFIGLVLSVHTHGIEPIGTANCGHGHSHNHHNHENEVGDKYNKYINFYSSPDLRKEGNNSEIQEVTDLPHSPLLERKIIKYSEDDNDGICNENTAKDNINGNAVLEKKMNHSNREKTNICNPQNSLALWSAYIHVLGDVLQNIGVMIAGIFIWYNPKFVIADPLCTILFSFFVLGTTFRILKDSTNVLMEGTPIGIDCVAIQEDFLKLYSVLEVHDLHVWSLSVGVPALSCHIVVASEESARATLRYATALCQTKYGIYHTTIQIDYSPNKVTCGTIHHQKCLVGSNNFLSNSK
ncbi:cation diffusion facilitator like membrane protein transporter [Cryptosporidium ryanae]|uniref:cation diffusion facilitator like membrane protein transporter n=1 Tax=Cryptosporidium ryanae TaxID=515981 RepID=UPI00351A0C40|nr:cation diffusion facilitator like membrane protein transporter [Cryptosporidium ryanae]